MASDPTLDFDSLLAPISEDAPCGVSLKDDPATSSLYYEIKDARNAASTAERAGEMANWDDGVGPSQSPAGKPDWQLVVRLASQATRDKTKDLWITAWLLEGQVRLHGFAGLRDGFRLIRELCERYFDCLHPRPDEDDGIATTMAQLAGLNGEGAGGALLGAIAALRITQGTSTGPFTGHDYADAEGIGRTADPDARAKRIAQGAATFEMFETAVRETSPQFFSELREDIEAAIDEFTRLTDVLTEKCGKDANGYSAAPPSSRIAGALNDSLARVRSFIGEEPAEESDPAGGGESAAGGESPRAAGNIAGREAAFKELMRVAEYFRRAEPHSPVSYALEQAVRWGRMELPELIQDLVSDEAVRREFFRRTGMKLPSDES